MNPGRLIYKSLLQINKQYLGSRLPLTGIVGFTKSRFRYPVNHVLREAFGGQRNDPDLDCKPAALLTREFVAMSDGSVHCSGI